MALKFTKRVKFVYDFAWVEDGLSLPNIILSLKQKAKALQACKANMWNELNNYVGEEPTEKAWNAGTPEEYMMWQPWFDTKLQTYLPPLSDGCLNGMHFSLKRIGAEVEEEEYPGEILLPVNKFELEQVTEYYVIQTVVIRRLSAPNVMNFVTQHRLLLYTSNF